VTTAQIVVTSMGLLAIVWVNYFFFLAGRRRGNQRRVNSEK
jgi:hypothetical protein